MDVEAKCNADQTILGWLVNYEIDEYHPLAGVLVNHGALVSHNKHGFVSTFAIELEPQLMIESTISILIIESRLTHEATSRIAPPFP